MRKATIFFILILIAGMACGQVITVRFSDISDIEDWAYSEPSDDWENTWPSYITVEVFRNGIELAGFERTFQIRRNTQDDLEDLADNATKYYSELAEVLESIDQTIAAVNSSVAQSDSQDRAHTRAAEDLPRYRQREEELYELIDTTMDDLRTEEGSGPFGWYYAN